MHADTALVRDHSNRFYIFMGGLMLAIVAAAFTSRYYARAVTGASAFAFHVHVHALLFTAWLLLFAMQAVLVRRGLLRSHRQFGIGGMVLAACIVTFGVYTAIEGARNGHSPVPNSNPLSFMIVGLVDIALFGGFVAAAWRFRKQRELHKRLMLFATLGGFLWPAVTRLPFLPLGPQRTPILFGLFAAVLIVPAVKDWLTRRQVHPLDVGAAFLIFVSLPVRRMIGLTDTWQRFAAWLTG